MKPRTILRCEEFESRLTPSTSHFEIPVSGFLGLPNGDVIFLSGTVKVDQNVTVDGNGGLHVLQHIVEHLDGQAVAGPDTGAKYQLNANENENINFTNGAPLEANLVINENIIGQGQAPNFGVQEIAHITVNANGDVVVDRIDIKPRS